MGVSFQSWSSGGLIVLIAIVCYGVGFILNVFFLFLLNVGLFAGLGVFLPFFLFLVSASFTYFPSNNELTPFGYKSFALTFDEMVVRSFRVNGFGFFGL